MELISLLKGMGMYQAGSMLKFTQQPLSGSKSSFEYNLLLTCPYVLASNHRFPGLSVVLVHIPITFPSQC